VRRTCRSSASSATNSERAISTFITANRSATTGVLGKEEMADLYRNCGKFLYTYYNDACSNTLIEALCSGCEVVGDKYYRKTGGAAEIMAAFRGRWRLK
jgi:glycosyltransferase involved in cell wall biosynthesis